MNALVAELWNLDSGLSEDTWNEHTCDKGGFGHQYVGSLDDFVGQLLWGPDFDSTRESDQTWNEPRNDSWNLSWNTSQVEITELPEGNEGSTSTQAGTSGAQVGAVVTSPSPGLALPKAKARATSTSAASVASAIVGAGVFDHFGLGASLQSPEGHFPISALHTSDFGSCHEFGTFKTLGDYALKASTTFHDPYMTEHFVPSMMDVDTWILFGSGAAASCCPRDFAPDWPLLLLSGKPPPLKSISGQPLNVIHVHMRTKEVQKHVPGPDKPCLVNAREETGQVLVDENEVSIHWSSSQ